MARAIDGEVWRFKTTPPFTTEEEPVDPTTVVFVWNVDNGTDTIWTYGVDSEVVHDGTGIYHVDFDTTGYAGQTINVEFVSTGVGQTVGIATLDVDPR